ncbi:hypothetical protein HYH03_010451 [Edaphochlamys debaryana]|uniref:Uncharacterized protein n=1 Tax=Edaphochlamys debaryana TaxID=47281 RepID=A0A836BXJ5_9CHLO|nr:hypothetical protein HYH03_010451 [Edaphochlamys debaryana]|eukprot:KAG2491244.1 hypothetical protein HYH03_010451 [Edaphochlamys debaryana]
MPVYSPPLPDPDPAAELLARCDEVRLLQLDWYDEADAAMEDVLEMVRRYGLPKCLERFGNHYLNLRGEPPLGRDPGRDPSPGAAPGASGIQPLSPEAMAARVAGRMSDGVDAASASSLLLRGRAVRALLADADALRAAVLRVGQEVTARLGPAASGSSHVVSYQPLPSAGALVLKCRDAASRAAAEAAAGALVLGSAGGGGGCGPGAAGASELAVLPCRTPYEIKPREEVQALWDGKDEGGPGPTTGSREGEVERLRWALETWDRLIALSEEWAEESYLT